MTEKIKYSEIYQTAPFELSFYHIFSPSSYDPTNPKYSFDMIFRNEEDMLKFKAVAKRVADKNERNLDAFRHPLIKHGDTMGHNGAPPKSQKFPLYVNKYYVTAKSRDPFPIAILDLSTGKPILANRDHEREFTPGCICIANLHLYYYNKGINEGIGIQIDGLVKIKNGTNSTFDPEASRRRLESIDYSAFQEEAVQSGVESITLSPSNVMPTPSFMQTGGTAPNTSFVDFGLLG